MTELIMSITGLSLNNLLTFTSIGVMLAVPVVFLFVDTDKLNKSDGCDEVSIDPYG